MKQKIICSTLLLFYSFIVLSQNVPDYFISSYDTSSTGYYFTNPRNTGVPPQLVNSYQIIFDGKGNVVYYKNFGQGVNTSSFTLNENGLMSYASNSKFYFMDSTFTIIDSVNCQNGVATDTHEMQILQNGNYLLMGSESITMDLSSYFLFGVNNFPGSSNATVQSVIIQELDASKNVVFEWHAIDHFAFDEVDKAWLTNPNVVDWTHSNAIEQDTDGNFLLSSRHFNEITKINRQDSSVMWRMGGNANQFTFLNDSMQFKRQHDIRRNASGNITLFDNGDGLNSNPFHFTAAKEYIIDEVAKTAFLNYSIVDDSLGYSSAMGNFDHHPGGISLVGYGLSSDYDKVFNAFNASGQKIFELEFVNPMISYRSFHYDSLPWSLNRPQISCYDINGIYYLDAGSGYSQYLWSNGETSQTIAVTDTGSFIVYVPAGQGGFLGSYPALVNDITNPCAFTGINELTAGITKMFPNPAKDKVTIVLNQTNTHHKNTVEIFDFSGKLLVSRQVFDHSDVTIDISELASGMYFVKYGHTTGKLLKQ